MTDRPDERGADDPRQALIRLLKYARDEARRLGLLEAAALIDLPILSISEMVRQGGQRTGNVA